jgi:hypothetical protein
MLHFDIKGLHVAKHPSNLFVSELLCDSNLTSVFTLAFPCSDSSNPVLEPYIRI